mmetsp:Transcript_1824/g.6147  ORF Transcript_1824/g.6147 Transcript_1824/m.6147 type:complete len:281 (+) Transcript_1824:3-845(+)
MDRRGRRTKSVQSNAEDLHHSDYVRLPVDALHRPLLPAHLDSGAAPHVAPLGLHRDGDRGSRSPPRPRRQIPLGLPQRLGEIKILAPRHRVPAPPDAYPHGPAFHLRPVLSLPQPLLPPLIELVLSLGLGALPLADRPLHGDLLLPLQPDRPDPPLLVQLRLLQELLRRELLLRLGEHLIDATLEGEARPGVVPVLAHHGALPRGHPLRVLAVVPVHDLDVVGVKVGLAVHHAPPVCILALRALRGLAHGHGHIVLLLGGGLGLLLRPLLRLLHALRAQA